MIQWYIRWMSVRRGLTTPMPEDSPIGRRDAEEVALASPKLSTVKSDGRYPQLINDGIQMFCQKQRP